MARARANALFVLPEFTANRPIAPSMSYFPPCIIDGEAIDLAHLNPFEVAFQIERLNGQTLTISVKFSNHCYTERFDPIRHVPANVVMDHVRKRALDPHRYALSKELPGLIWDLIDRAVHRTRSDRNYVYVATVGVGGTHYSFFFTLKREGKRLVMFVESAYPVQDPKDVLEGATKISFAVLCAKVWRNEPIKPRTRR